MFARRRGHQPFLPIVPDPKTGSRAHRVAIDGGWPAGLMGVIPPANRIRHSLTRPATGGPVAPFLAAGPRPGVRAGGRRTGRTYSRRSSRTPAAFALAPPGEAVREKARRPGSEISGRRGRSASRLRRDDFEFQLLAQAGLGQRGGGWRRRRRVERAARGEPRGRPPAQPASIWPSARRCRSWPAGSCRQSPRPT